MKLNSLRSDFMYENSIASLTSEEKARPYDALLSVKTPTRSRYLWVKFTETKKFSFCALHCTSLKQETRNEEVAHDWLALVPVYARLVIRPRRPF